MADATKHEELGVFSLRAAVAGFVLPILGSLALLIWDPPLDAGERQIFLIHLGVLFGGLELIGLLVGFVAWGSRGGKSAVILSFVLILAAVGLVTTLLPGGGELAEEPAQPAAPPSDPPEAPAPAPPPPPVRKPSVPPPTREPSGGHEPGELFPDVPAEG